MKDYVPPEDLDEYVYLHYPVDYRILDCWDCFQAEGKLCSDEDHNSLFHHTKSSNKFETFCCKPDNNEGYCQSGNRHDNMGVENGITTVCSQPSAGAND
jgi:hypothetical protein